jgi:sugar diacid utilization regulator
VVHDECQERDTTEFVMTPQAWLQPQSGPAEPDERLGTHENTVRYRLRQPGEIANLQPDDAKKRLSMMVELAATDTD